MHKDNAICRRHHFIDLCKICGNDTLLGPDYPFMSDCKDDDFEALTGRLRPSYEAEKAKKKYGPANYDCCI